MGKPSLGYALACRPKQLTKQTPGYLDSPPKIAHNIGTHLYLPKDG